MSPIEELFMEAWNKHFRHIPLTFQHRVRISQPQLEALYIIDFAYLPMKIGIELDGMRGHSKPADIEKDRKRQRALERDDWQFIRFGGREITKDVKACVLEVESFLIQRACLLKAAGVDHLYPLLGFADVAAFAAAHGIPMVDGKCEGEHRYTFMRALAQSLAWVRVP